MRRLLRGVFSFCIPMLIFCLVGVGVQAIGESQLSTNTRTPVISYGLDVIADATDIRVAATVGETVNFSKRNFMAGLNLSDIERLEITSLPSSADGVLYFGAEQVRVGQTIQGDEIDKMTFSPSDKDAGECASFRVRANGVSYDTVCRIYALDKMNVAPTTGSTPYASHNIRTHKNISTFGVLSGYDADGDELTFEIVKYPEDGVLRLTDKTHGAYTYTPCDSFVGKDSFTYVVRDRYGSFSASAEVSVTVSTPSVSVVYSDLYGSDVYTHALRLTEENIMNGIQVGELFYFRPENKVTRAEFLVTAMNALGIKDIPTVADTGFFDDADILPEMKGYVALAYSLGYISGTRQDGEICFLPDEQIKLSEAAVVISNIIGYSTPDVRPVFSNTSEIPEWSERAVISLHTLGVIQSGDGCVDATKILTRGEMAKLLSRAMQIASA